MGNLTGMASTPKTGSAYTYSADTSRPADPALAGLSSGTQVTVNGYDKDSRQVRVGWTDAAGAQQEASVAHDSFDGSFSKNS